VQQRDLRCGDQCGTAIDELPRFVKDWNAQDIPLRMVNTTIKIPRASASVSELRERNVEINEVAAATWFISVVATTRLVAVATATVDSLTSGWQSTDLTRLELIVTPFLLGIQCFE
jgi:hypothetical protein